MPSSPASSPKVSRVMPWRTPSAGVRSTPALTMKTLERGAPPQLFLRARDMFIAGFERVGRHAALVADLQSDSGAPLLLRADEAVGRRHDEDVGARRARIRRARRQQP